MTAIALLRPDGSLNAPYTPLGTPLHWRDEESGVLVDAIALYVGTGLGAPGQLAPEQFALVRAYCQYVIDAPCWRDGEVSGALQRLRERIRTVGDAEQLDTWIMDCLTIGIDPL